MQPHLVSKGVVPRSGARKLARDAVCYFQHRCTMISCGDSALSRLVLLGLGEAKLTVLEEMLGALADQCGGFGVTLWQLRGVDGSLFPYKNRNRFRV